MIHGRHHSRAGAPVRTQGVVSAHLITRFDVSENIGATEGVNRLFRVADHQQATLRMVQIQPTENAVLQRVGILEFVDHRHRIKRADPLAQ
ncbi:Uncharacterised protein [Vibrio cholerae]|nr:Uncharacterised protein [Vibrio cholerae]CSA88120.1 Uncharacterised protein [Vibrio cholerae]